MMQRIRVPLKYTLKLKFSISLHFQLIKATDLAVIAKKYLNLSMLLAYLFTLLVTSPSRGDSFMKPGNLCRTEIKKIIIPSIHLQPHQRCKFHLTFSTLNKYYILQLSTFIIISIHSDMGGTSTNTTSMHIFVLSLQKINIKVNN